MTDCFLTHDWGRFDELGVEVRIHDRVSRINTAVAEKGLVNSRAHFVVVSIVSLLLSEMLVR
jgi:hypothetical protein